MPENSNSTPVLTSNTPHKIKRGGQTGTLTPPDDCRQMAVSGNYVYVADAAFGLRIIDVSNPSSPTQIGSYEAQEGSADTRNTGIAIQGNYAYLANGDYSSIYRLNISDPTNPTLVNGIIGHQRPVYLAVNGNYLYSATLAGLGMRTYDISNTNVSPILVNNYPISGSSEAVVKNGQYLYLVNQDNGLYIFDISTPSTPNLVATCSNTVLGTGPSGIALTGNYAYLTTGSTALKIVGISDPTNPNCLAGTYSIGGPTAYKIAYRSNYLYLSNGFVLNINNSTAPVYAGTSGIGGAGNQGIMINGNFAYSGKTFSVVKIAPPVLVNKTITLNEGQTITLTTSNFSATDADDGSASLTFTISNFAGGGRFQLSSNPGVAITSFTLQQISSGLVQFVDDGNEVAPSFKVSVSDGMTFTQPVSATINYTPVNDAPTLSSTSTSPITFAESAEAVVVNPNLIITDVDNINLASATVTIGGFVAGEDVLTLPTNPQNGITAAFNTTTGVLTLTGSSSVANYRAALRSVTYQNTSENPSTGARSIGIRVNDGVANSTVLSRNLSVVASNGAPVLSSSSTSAVNFTEETGTVVIDQNLTVIDTDSTDLNSAAVSIIGYVAGTDTLILPINPQNGITAIFNTSTGVLNLTGSSSLAHYQAALRTVIYENQNNTVVANRSIEFLVNDGAANSNTFARDINLVPLNNLLSGTSNSLMCFNQGSEKLICPQLNILGDSTVTLESATVTITNAASEDTLAFDDLSYGISSNYTNGILTLTGPASAERFAETLRTVKFSNTNNNLTATNRGFNVTVNFEGQSSNNIASQLELITLNDAPVVINPVEDFNVTVNEPFSTVLSSHTFSQPINDLTLFVTENEGALTSLSFDTTTRRLNGSLATTGENRFGFFASDRCNQTTASNFIINAFNPQVTPPSGSPLAPGATPVLTPFTDSNAVPTMSVQDNTGPIVGGIVGGIAGLVILGGAIFGGLWAWRKKQAKKSTDIATNPAVINTENPVVSANNNAEEMVETSASSSSVSHYIP